MHNGRTIEEKELVPLITLYEELLMDFQEHPTKANELVHVGESQFDETLNVEELSALAMISSTVMNYDEFVMKR